MFFLWLLIILLPNSSPAYIMSKAKPVKIKPKKTSAYFDVFFHGIDAIDPKIQEALEKDIAFPEKGVGCLNNVHQWALARIPLIETILASFGHYEAQIDFFVDVRSDPQIIYFNIQHGPLYTLGAFSIKSDPPHHGPITVLKRDLEKFGIKLGMPANKHSIHEVKEAILEDLGNSGYPFALVTGERIVLNRSKKTMLVFFKIRANKMVRYGNVILEGNGITGEFLKPFLNWEKGDVYNKEFVEETAQMLMNTGVFKSVTIKLSEVGPQVADLTPEEIKNNNDAPEVVVDLHCHLVPKKASLVQIQSTIQNDGGGFGFEGVRHNVLQKGETFYLDCFFGSNQSYISPGFLFTDVFYVLGLQSLTTVNVLTERFPGFTTARLSLRQAFDFAVNKHLGFSLGVGAEYYTYPDFYPLKQKDSLNGAKSEVFAGIILNFLDNPAKPSRGWLVKALGVGSIGMQGDFRSSQIKASLQHFSPFGKRQRLVWKKWFKMTATPTHFTTGPDLVLDIPPHMLLFLGGPGGLRGFGRQPFAPIPKNYEMTPLYSSLLFGSEINYHITDNFSLSAFLDVGEAFKSNFPTITWPMHYSIGGSAELFTRFGVFSLTVAAPMREESYTHPLEVSVAFKPLLSLE